MTPVAGPAGAADDGPMTVLSRRSSTADLVRGTAVVVLAVVQIVVSGLAAGGALGDPVVAVAREYATPLLAAGWAFGIWAVVYAGFLAYAIHQLRAGQRRRAVHRDTGWWIAASAVLNPAWVLAFSARLMPLAELLIIGLLGCLAVVFARVSRVPAEGVVERVVFRGTIAVYAGWVSMATVLGTAATGVWIGLPGEGALAAVAAILVLLAAAAITASVVTSATGVAGYAAAVLWALAGIALNGPPVPVVVAAAVAVVIVLAAVARRVGTAGNPARAAWG
jgi:benzodiazapine receptor